MTFIHICPNCRATFRYATAEDRPCPDCSVMMISTKITDGEWDLLSSQERMQIRNDVKDGVFEQQRLERERYEEELKRREEEERNQMLAAAKQQFEYDVAVVDPSGGESPADALKRVLSAYAAQGWKLHTLYPKAGSPLAGEGNHAASGQDILIFERKTRERSDW